MPLQMPAQHAAHPALHRLVEQVRAARAAKTPLDIRGGNTKAWYGNAQHGQVLDVTPLCGITNHEPTELVATVLAGTPLVDLEAALAEHGQCLAFEPPHFNRAAGPTGTVGGMVAAGLAGPARASAGSVRDHVLGATLLNGRGELLHFGGQVIKNVAGYDVSRLLAGSLGVLGVICEVSLKVLPVLPATATLRFELDEAAALKRLNAWGGQPLPLSASAWWDGMLVLRLAGAVAAVHSAQLRLGGEVIAPPLAGAFWAGLRDQTDEFFTAASKAVSHGATLWRLSVPQTAPPMKLSGEHLVEWHGGQRWLCTSAAPGVVRDAALAVGGHATVFRSAGGRALPDAAVSGAFPPLRPPLDRIHRQLKTAFDPDRVFNRGRLYPAL